MQIFIDTANLDEIKIAKSWGIVDGITTNPSLIKKEVERLKGAGQPVNMEAHIKNILQVAGEDVPVSLEVTATDAARMAQQGKTLFKKFNDVANNVVIKIPVNTYVSDHFDGLKAIKILMEAEIPVNSTLIFTPEQALLAAKAGATYVSPFVGRIDDYIRQQAGIEFAKTDYFPAEGWEAEADEEDEDAEEEMLDDEGILSGVDLVTKIADMFEKHDIDDCYIIAASIRNPRQVREVAFAGAHIATIPPAILHTLLDHAKTREGLNKFKADVVPSYQAVVGGAPAQAAPQQSVPQGQPAQPRPAQPSAHDLINRTQ